MFSTRLKELRAKKGVTQDDMAEFLQVKRQTYGAYERGVSMPDIPSLIKLASYFNVSVDDLLGTDSKIANMTENQKTVLRLAEQLSEEGVVKLIEHAELLKKAETQ